ncbi:OvmZ protein [Streptomyces rhizosphaericola]|uniref:OvmZ protein n=1 Tax=Streptomyces rhizosphaericola TaxID=2564098 RepID=UPI003BF48991
MHQYSELSVGHVGRDCATLCGSICRQCVERLRGELRNLLDLYRESDHALAPAHARLRQRVSGTRAVGTVLDERTVAMRTETAEVLASWARLVVEERGARGLRDCDVESLVEFLHGQVEWLAGHPAAVSFDDEVRGLLRRIGSVLGPAPASGRPLGACVEPGCTGTLLAVAREAGGVSPGPDRVTCDAGHTLPPRQWLAVAGQLARRSL